MVRLEKSTFGNVETITKLSDKWPWNFCYLEKRSNMIVGGFFSFNLVVLMVFHGDVSTAQHVAG